MFVQGLTSFNASHDMLELANIEELSNDGIVELLSRTEKGHRLAVLADGRDEVLLGGDATM